MVLGFFFKMPNFILNNFYKKQKHKDISYLLGGPPENGGHLFSGSQRLFKCEKIDVRLSWRFAFFKEPSCSGKAKKIKIIFRGYCTGDCKNKIRSLVISSLGECGKVFSCEVLCCS